MEASTKVRKRRKAPYVQMLKTPAGKRYRARIQVEGKRLLGTLRLSVDDAEKDATAMREQHDRMPDQLLTIKEALDLPAEEARANGKRDGTVAFYEVHSEKDEHGNRRTIGHGVALLRGFDGGKPLHSITAKDVEKYISLRLRRDKVSAATVRHEFALLRRALRLAVAKGHLNKNPLEGMKPPKVDVPEDVDFFTLEEVREILAAMQQAKHPCAKRDHDIVGCLFLSGLRRSELARLEVRDVDLRAGMVKVDGKRGPRTVPISDELRPIVARMAIGRRHDQPLLDGETEKKRCGLVTSIFSRWAGAPHGKRKVPVRLPKHLAKRLRAHVMRHSFATAILRAGAKAHDAEKLLGHKDPNMTKRYVHSVEDDRRNAVNLLTLSPQPSKPEPSKPDAQGAAAHG